MVSFLHTGTDAVFRGFILIIIGIMLFIPSGECGTHLASYGLQAKLSEKPDTVHEKLYSGTSNKGPYERGTTSLQRTLDANKDNLSTREKNY